MKECMTCGHIGDDVYDCNKDAPFDLLAEYICEDCAEAAYDRQMEQAMEDAA